MIRKISAHFVVTGNGDILKNGIISIDQTGSIVDIKAADKNFKEIAGLEFYSGVLVPGFINCHCHLELSHLKDKISKYTGLQGFIPEIIKQRSASQEIILKKAQLADNKMFADGIVAVGDIANNSDTIGIKQKSPIKYHTFVELFTGNPHAVKNKFEMGINLEKAFQKAGLQASITAHAPYSVTPDLFTLISDHIVKSNSILSIHNQECQSESDLYINKTGALYDMFTSLSVDLNGIPKTGKSSLQSILQFLNPKTKTILVHNTYSEIEDIESADNHLDNLYWCLCPNANLYIENRLPDIDNFRNKKQKICIGTDSLASNSQLSVLDELKVISKAYPYIEFSELISWATINGAEALNLSDKLGSFQIGKQSGINLIENFNFANFRLISDSKIRKIV